MSSIKPPAREAGETTQMSNKKQPVNAQLAPYVREVKAGRTYNWCSCGRSARQPFCDGSHEGTGFEPVKFVPEESGIIFFCGCKETCVRPLCDNTHARIKGYRGVATYSLRQETVVKETPSGGS